MAPIGWPLPTSAHPSGFHRRAMEIGGSPMQTRIDTESARGWVHGAGGGTADQLPGESDHRCGPARWTHHHRARGPGVRARCLVGAGPQRWVGPQGHQLLRYMAGRSRGAAVACDHSKLIKALWGDREEWPAHRFYTRADVAGVVRAARRCIEPVPSEARILETVTGIGHRLDVCAGTPPGNSA